MDSDPAKSVGRPETAVPNTTSCWPVSHISNCAQAACSTVLTVVRHERASSPSRRLVSADTPNSATPRGPSPIRPDGPTSVGVSKPASTSRHAASAAARSCSDSQVMKLRYRTGAGSRTPK